MDGLDMLVVDNGGAVDDDDSGLEPFCRFTLEEVRDYAAMYGKAAAASWLLLIPPDRFDGDLEAAFAEMCGES